VENPLCQTINLTSATYLLDGVDATSCSPSVQGASGLCITQSVALVGANRAPATLQPKNGRVLYIGKGAHVNLTNVIITGGAVCGDGGGIFNEGTLLMRDSQLLDNVASVKPGLGGGRGGGIFHQGSDAQLGGVAVLKNVASKGGGVFLSDSNMTVVRSNFLSNTASAPGGGSAIANTGAATNLAIATNSHVPKESISGNFTRFNKVQTNASVSVPEALSIATLRDPKAAYSMAKLKLRSRRLGWAAADLEGAFEQLLWQATNLSVTAALEAPGGGYVDRAFVTILDDPVVPWTADSDLLNRDDTPHNLLDKLGLANIGTVLIENVVAGRICDRCPDQ